MKLDEIDRKVVSGKSKERICKIGAYIKRLRYFNNITQQDLAFYIFSDKSLISELERGNCSNITLHTLMKIADVFKIEVEVLVRG